MLEKPVLSVAPVKTPLPCSFAVLCVIPLTLAVTAGCARPSDAQSATPIAPFSAAASAAASTEPPSARPAASAPLRDTDACLITAPGGDPRELDTPGDACFAKAEAIRQSLDFALDPERKAEALHLYEVACRAGTRSGCEWAANLLSMSGQDAEAVPYYATNCDLGAAQSCKTLGELAGRCLFLSDDTRPKFPFYPVAQRWLQRAFDLGDGDAGITLQELRSSPSRQHAPPWIPAPAECASLARGLTQAGSPLDAPLCGGAACADTMPVCCRGANGERCARSIGECH